ncbi:acyl carrier protein [Paenibacillus sp. DS2015]|uniref:acyl carrier protein n=1 Tax=Paenibacillus sp. DS2015 TaxID=3373917 RepID=UPI003D1D86FD
MSYEELLETVLNSVKEVLNTKDFIDSNVQFIDIPTFDSMSLFMLVSSIEAQLEFTIPPDLLTPDVFKSPASIVEAVLPIYKN